jgi:hypothetical protein
MADPTLSAALQAASSKNTHLLSVLAATDPVPSLLTHQTALIADLDANLASARVRCAELERTRERAVKEEGRLEGEIRRREEVQRELECLYEEVLGGRRRVCRGRMSWSWRGRGCGGRRIICG